MKPKPQSETPETGIAEEITEQKTEPLKKCFVVMPIADPITDYDPGHFKRVYDYIIRPACAEAGFEPVRADEIKSSNVIILDIIKKILDYDMVVCDLSNRNPNVLYELALRQAFDKPVTLIKDDITTEPFDIQGIRYTVYDKELRIDLVEKVIKELAASISETYKQRGKDYFSLIQLLGIERATFKTSDLSDDTLAILRAINDLKGIKPSPLYSDALPQGVVNVTLYAENERTNIPFQGSYLIGGQLINHKSLGQGRFKGVGSYGATGVLLIDFGFVNLTAIDPDSPDLQRIQSTTVTATVKQPTFL